MRIMYDSVNPARIPRDAEIVAGYASGKYQWSDTDWALFPDAVHVEIAVRAYHNVGQVLDVETGDADPSEAPSWVNIRRAAGVDPTVYCNSSTWPTVARAFNAAGVVAPHYWIAHYDGDPTIPDGAVAKQYKNTADWDASSVRDYWPGIDIITSPFSGDDMSTKLQAVLDSAGHPVKTYDVIPVNGLRSLALATSYGHPVQITGLTGVYDTGRSPQTVGVSHAGLWAFQLDADKPGPIALPAGLRHVVVEYIASVNFRGWAY